MSKTIILGTASTKKGLKVTKHPVTYIVEYRDFEKFVEEVYGVTNYSLPATQEASNDTSITLDVGPGDLVDQDRIDEFVKDNGEKCWMIHDLFADLVKRNILPAGYYVINISW